jgi:hypothetical protein
MTSRKATVVVTKRANVMELGVNTSKELHHMLTFPLDQMLFEPLTHESVDVGCRRAAFLASLHSGRYLAVFPWMAFVRIIQQSFHDHRMELEHNSFGNVVPCDLLKFLRNKNVVRGFRQIVFGSRNVRDLSCKLFVFGASFPPANPSAFSFHPTTSCSLHGRERSD